jgi:uncharacterized protein (DUF736 family)
MPTSATTTNRTASTTPNAWDQKELGCLWKKAKKADGEKFLSGILNLKNVPGFPDKDVEIVVFSNKKKTKDTQPDLRIYISEKREGNGRTAPAPAAAATAAPAAVTPDAGELI